MCELLCSRELLDISIWLQLVSQSERAIKQLLRGARHVTFCVSKIPQGTPGPEQSPQGEERGPHTSRFGRQLLLFLFLLSRH